MPTHIVSISLEFPDAASAVKALSDLSAVIEKLQAGGGATAVEMELEAEADPKPAEKVIEHHYYPTYPPYRWTLTVPTVTYTRDAGAITSASTIGAGTNTTATLAGWIGRISKDASA